MTHCQDLACRIFIAMCDVRCAVIGTPRDSSRREARRRDARRIARVRVSPPNFLYGVFAVRRNGVVNPRSANLVPEHTNNKAWAYLRSAFYRRQ